MTYVATVNVPGYLLMDDEPPTFDTTREAWQYLADERQHSEDDSTATGDPYSDTYNELQGLAQQGTDAMWDGTGTVHGPTPGRNADDPHDQGLAYSVTVTVAEDDDQ